MFSTDGRTPLPFDDSRFTQYWETTMKSTTHIAYCPPSLFRTSFIEDYTSENGVEPDMWDGAACVMGNSVRQWRESYNPSRRSRQARATIAAHSRYVSRRIEDAQRTAAARDEEGLEDDEQM
jgi:hypothetical protein